MEMHREDIFWFSVKDSREPEDLEAYIIKFPDGLYSDIARRKIRKLRGQAPEKETF